MNRRMLTDISATRVLHIGGYWRQSSDTVLQMMLGLKSAGASVREFNTDEHRDALDTEGRDYDRGTYGPVWLRRELIQDEIDLFDPQIIVCNAGGLSFRPDDARKLREKRFLLGIALSDPDVFEPATSRIAGNFDLFLTNAPECIPAYQARGVRVAPLRFGTNIDIFHPVRSSPEHVCQVAVFGAAHADRIEPVKAISERFNLHLFGENWEQHGLRTRGLVFGDELLCALNSAAITVIFFQTRGGHPVIKPGIIDFIAAGALVATPYFSRLESYFAFDREVIGFGSTTELIERIDYFLSHPDEAARVRQAGRDRVLRDHTWGAVWLSLFEQLQRM